MEGFATFRISEVFKPVRDELNFESEQAIISWSSAMPTYANMPASQRCAQAHKEPGDCRHLETHCAGRMSKPPKPRAMAQIPVGMRMGDLPFFNAGCGVSLVAKRPETLAARCAGRFRRARAERCRGGGSGAGLHHLQDEGVTSSGRTHGGTLAAGGPGARQRSADSTWCRSRS